MRNLPGEVTVNVSVKQSPIKGPSVEVHTSHEKMICGEHIIYRLGGTVELPVAPQVNGWAMLNSVKSSLEGKWIQFYRRIVCDLYVKFPRAQITSSKELQNPGEKMSNIITTT